MKYRRVKDNVAVEAFEWTGDIDETEAPEWINDALSTGKAKVDNFGHGEDMEDNFVLLLRTPKGTRLAKTGDYVVHIPGDGIYPYKRVNFETTHEAEE